MKNKYAFNPEVHDPTALLSISQIQQFMKCPRAWHFNYVDRIVPRVEARFLTLGKLCHIGMEAAFRERYRQQVAGETDYERIIQAGNIAIGKEYSESEDLHPTGPDGAPFTLVEILPVYWEAIKRVDPLNWDVVEGPDGTPLIEYHFYTPCVGCKGIHGFIDIVMRERTSGDVWAVDWKFRSQFSSESEVFNLQSLAYNYVLRRMGVRLTGSMVWQFVNQPPAVPTLNKNGSMSRAKIRTTWEAYSNALRVYGLDPKEYEEEMVPKLDTIEWERTLKEYVNSFTLQNTWDRFIVPVARIITSKHKRVTASMFPWNCRICCYNPICLADMRGYDVDFIKREGFMPRDQPPEVEGGKNDIDDTPVA